MMIPEVGLATVLAPGGTAGPVTVHGVALGLARAAAPTIVPVIALSVGMVAATVVILRIELPLLLFQLCLLYLPRHNLLPQWPLPTSGCLRFSPASFTSSNHLPFRLCHSLLELISPLILRLANPLISRLHSLLREE